MKATGTRRQLIDIKNLSDHEKKNLLILEIKNTSIPSNVNDEIPGNKNCGQCTCSIV